LSALIADALSIIHNGGGQVLIRLHGPDGIVFAVACLRGAKIDEAADLLTMAITEAKGGHRVAADAGRG